MYIILLNIHIYIYRYVYALYNTTNVDDTAIIKKMIIKKMHNSAKNESHLSSNYART